MSILKLQRPPERGEIDHERVMLIAAFVDLMDRLDRGDLAGAARMQAELKRRGVTVTCECRPGRGKGATSGPR